MSRKPEQDPIDGYLANIRSYRRFMPILGDPIESYLADVHEYLEAIPAEDATTAIEEMRCHIHAAISELVANGTEEEQAVVAVLKRFGSPKTVGKATAKAFLNAWLSDGDRREVISIARSLVAAWYLLVFGLLTTIPLLVYTQHPIPIWSLAVAFLVGLTGTSLDVIIRHVAHLRLPPRERLNELSGAYAELTNSLGLRPFGGNPIANAYTRFFSEIKETKTSQKVTFFILYGIMTITSFWSGDRVESPVGLFLIGAYIGKAATSRLLARLNSNAEIVNN